MKCQQCGKENVENAKFCGECGSNFSSEEVTAPPPGLPSVGFGEAISRGFTNYFKFSGRSSRPEYWWWTLFCSLLAIIPFSILVTFIPSLAVTSRRLHDKGKSGWWQILPLGGLMGGLIGMILSALLGSLFSLLSMIIWLFPVGIVLLIVWLAKKGDEGPNKYGPDPIQPTQ